MKNIKLYTALFAMLFVAQFAFAQAALDNGRTSMSAPSPAIQAEEPAQNKDIPQPGVYPVDFDNNANTTAEVTEDVYYPIDAQIAQDEILASAHPAVVAEKINAMNQTVEDLRSLVEELRLENKVMRKSIGNCCSASNLGLSANDAYLVQNAPNPFTEAAEINYFVPQGLENVEIRICDFKGAVLKTIDIKESGYGKIKVDAAGLNIGSFVYLLAVQDEVIDSKVMMITK